MKTDCQTLRSSTIKRARETGFNKPDKRAPETPPAVSIPAYIFNLGRTLSNTELLLLHKIRDDVEESAVPTAADFDKLSKIMQRTSYSNKDEFGRVTTTHVNIQPITALKDDYVLSAEEKSLIFKVVDWLAILAKFARM